MYRRVSMAKLAAAAGDLMVTMAQPQTRIEDGARPSPNCDFDDVA
jgi:hypothetical protein